MLRSMSSSEVTGWMGYYKLLQQEQEESNPGSTVHPDEEIEEWY